MRVTLIGGLDRLDSHYRREAEKAGHELKIFNQYRAGMECRMGTSEAVVLFTAQVSHQARNHAFEAARNLGIPVFQSHSSGLSAFRTAILALGAHP